jgi:hypothetical protein
MVDEKDFTPFSRNKSFKDRHGKVIWCRNCCIDFVSSKGNTLEALKELLQIIDIPYIEKYAKSALANYKKKLKATNIVTRKNVYDGNETTNFESNKLQTSVYTCYASRLGVLPKTYVNFSFSDGIRNDKKVEDTELTFKNLDDEVQKEILWSIKFIKKIFGEQLYEDKENLSKAIKLKMDEHSLHKNDNLQRQNKFRLKKAVLILIDNRIFNKKDYSFLYVDEEETDSEDEEEITENEIDIPDNIDLKKMQLKWGVGYSPIDYVLFENKYLELKRNYEVKTSPLAIA